MMIVMGRSGTVYLGGGAKGGKILKCFINIKGLVCVSFSRAFNKIVKLMNNTHKVCSW